MNKTYKFVERIEDMSIEEINEHITESMDINTAQILKTIDYNEREEIIVQHVSSELIAICPATGYPDFYTITVKYIPNKKIIELKSLKFYLMQYINIPITHEHLSVKVYRDLKTILNPKKLNIHLKVARRGGIDTIVEIGDKEIECNVNKW